jgi:hypothetical protein
VSLNFSIRKKEALDQPKCTLFQNNSIHGDVCMEDRNREKTDLRYVAWSLMDGQTDDGLLIIRRAVRSVTRLENNLHQQKCAAL